MNGVVPLVGQDPLLDKIMVAMLEDHFEKTKGCCTDPRCWVNVFYTATMQLGAIRPEAHYAIIN